MEEEKKWEQIDDYLMDRLSPDDKAAFERQLEDDEELRDAVHTEKELMDGLHAYADKTSFFEIFSETREEKKTGADPTIEPRKGGVIRRLVPVIAIAASIALLIVAWNYFSASSVNSSQLAQTYFEIGDDAVSPYLSGRGLAGNTDPETQQLAQNAYNQLKQGRFAEARDSFERLQSTQGAGNYLRILADYYLGQIAWQQADYEKALNVLLPLTTKGALPISNEIQWYTALSYLSMDRKAEAIVHLKNIEENNELHSKAQTLLRELE